MAGNFFLVGLPGAGKSTLGKLLAQKTGYVFVDADQAVVEKTGVDILTIFSMEGEVGFRVRESAVIDELTQHQGIVLATGGGVVLSSANCKALHTRGRVIYLHTLPEVLLARVQGDRNRPLLQSEDPLVVLKRLYKERDPLYRAVADDVVAVENVPYAQTAHILFSCLDLL